MTEDDKKAIDQQFSQINHSDDQPQKPSHDMHGACSECVPQKPECTCGSLRTKGYCAVHSSPGEIARKLGQAIEASFDKPDASALEFINACGAQDKCIPCGMRAGAKLIATDEALKRMGVEGE